MLYQFSTAQTIFTFPRATVFLYQLHYRSCNGKAGGLAAGKGVEVESLAPRKLLRVLYLGSGSISASFWIGQRLLALSLCGGVGEEKLGYILILD